MNFPENATIVRHEKDPIAVEIAQDLAKLSLDQNQKRNTAVTDNAAPVNRKRLLPTGRRTKQRNTAATNVSQSNTTATAPAVKIPLHQGGSSTAAVGKSIDGNPLPLVTPSTAIGGQDTVAQSTRGATIIEPDQGTGDSNNQAPVSSDTRSNKREGSFGGQSNTNPKRLILDLTSEGPDSSNSSQREPLLENKREIIDLTSEGPESSNLGQGDTSNNKRGMDHLMEKEPSFCTTPVSVPTVFSIEINDTEESKNRKCNMCKLWYPREEFVNAKNRVLKTCNTCRKPDSSRPKNHTVENLWSALKKRRLEESVIGKPNGSSSLPSSSSSSHEYQQK